MSSIKINPTSLKILFIFDTFNSGGAGRQFTQLNHGLADRHVNTKIIVLEGGHYLKSMLSSKHNITLFNRRHRYDLHPFFSISRVIREYSPDIVHAWGWMSSLAAFPAAKLYGIPLLGSLRTATLPRKAIFRFLAHLKNLQFSGIISNSNAALKNYSIKPSKGYLVYNGFDTKRIPEHGNRNEKFTVIMAARMSAEKDWDTFVNSIKILKKRGLTNAIQFVGLGDGVCMPKVRKQASELIAAGILILPGFSKEPMRWMINADVGILATKLGVFEGTSNSILEYMACSLPVVCSRSGGNLETVIQDQTGILVTPGCPEEMANAIELLYSSPEKKAEMGNRGKERLLKFYSFDTSIENTLDIYRSFQENRADLK